MENIDREIRRVVEAMRKEQQEQTTAQERGKKVCFTEEEKETQEAQEWQERFVEKRRRAQKARGEEWREREKRRCEEDDDERVSVVPNMEAGSSYLQTSDPRAEAEKVVTDGFEERQTGRGSGGLVRGGEYSCQTNETSRKGKGKGIGGKGEREGKGGEEEGKI